MTTHMQASARRAAQLLAVLAEPEGRADPYPLYDQLRALGPVVAAPDGRWSSLATGSARRCCAITGCARHRSGRWPPPATRTGGTGRRCGCCTLAS